MRELLYTKQLEFSMELQMGISVVLREAFLLASATDASGGSSSIQFREAVRKLFDVTCVCFVSAHRVRVFSFLQGES